MSCEHNVTTSPPSPQAPASMSSEGKVQPNRRGKRAKHWWRLGKARSNLLTEAGDADHDAR